MYNEETGIIKESEEALKLKIDNIGTPDDEKIDDYLYTLIDDIEEELINTTTKFIKRLTQVP